MTDVIQNFLSLINSNQENIDFLMKDQLFQIESTEQKALSAADVFLSKMTTDGDWIRIDRVTAIGLIMRMRGGRRVIIPDVERLSARMAIEGSQAFVVKSGPFFLSKKRNLIVNGLSRLCAIAISDRSEAFQIFAMDVGT